MSDEDWKAYESDCLDARMFLRDAMKAGWTLTPPVTLGMREALRGEVIACGSIWRIGGDLNRSAAYSDAVNAVIAIARGEKP